MNGFVGWWSVLWLAGTLICVPAWAHPEIETQIADVTARMVREPDDAGLFIRRGELHRVHRDWTAAEGDFLQARKIAPELSEVDFHLGRLQLEAGAPKQAKATLDRFIARHPDHPGGRLTRARAQIELGRPLAAVRDYDRVIELETRPQPTHYIERAEALLAAGPKHFDRAVDGLDQGLERLSGPVTLQICAIDLELTRGRHDAALLRVDRIAAESPRKESWLVRRGEILEQAGRPLEARRAYDDALLAIERLPASRRWNRAVERLQLQAEEAVIRLTASNR